MPRSTTTFSISLPPKMAAQLERVRKSEHRTRSELVREALRRYIRTTDIQSLQARLGRLPEEAPEADELSAIEEGQFELRSGKYATLIRPRHELRRPRKPARAKKP
jgi:Arc/MetJ-type ribon-helix-helix transcriptional regulator